MKHSPFAKVHPLPVVAALLCGSAGLIGACNIVGPVGFLVAGEEKIPALYKLDPERPTVVFIDDRASRVPDRMLRSIIGRVAEQALLEEKLVKEVISSDGLASVVARERFGKPMGIAEVGAAVGAEVVVYATIDEFTLSADQHTFAPKAAARVKVIDTKTKQRLWPVDDPGWHVVAVQIPERQGTVPSGAGDISAAQRELAAKLGDAITKIFYAHQRYEGSERIGR